MSTIAVMTGQLVRWADRGSATEFDRRYTAGSVAFWAATLTGLADIRDGQRVADIGCGTGGLTVGIAGRSGARLVGCDLAARFIEHARHGSVPVDWLVADAVRLPFPAGPFDRVLMSLLLHRVPDPVTVIAESFRILRPGGILLVKTVAPDHAANESPYRFFPTVAAAQRARLPATKSLVEWAAAAGFAEPEIALIRRETRVPTRDMERSIRADAPTRYPEMSTAELNNGVQRMRAESDRTEERIHTVVVARKPWR